MSHHLHFSSRIHVGLSLALMTCGAGLSGVFAGELPIQTAPADWFQVVSLDAETYQISEPKGWGQTFSYLLIGKQRALLFDTDAGRYSMRPEVRSLTSLPLIVIPSHLHFDHTSGLAEFSDVRLLDTPALRAEIRDGEFVETHTQSMLRNEIIKFPVAGWIKDGGTIDLGDRRVTLLSTPGHTPDSVSLVDQGGKRLFTGDLINRNGTLLNVPGSDLRAEARSLHGILALTPGAELAYEAHGQAPVSRAELEQLAVGIDAIIAGRVSPKPMCFGGVRTRQFDVGSFPIFLPRGTGLELQPLRSSQETIQIGGTCSG